MVTAILAMILGAWPPTASHLQPATVEVVAVTAPSYCEPCRKLEKSMRAFVLKHQNYRFVTRPPGASDQRIPYLIHGKRIGRDIVTVKQLEQFLLPKVKVDDKTTEMDTAVRFIAVAV